MLEINKSEQDKTRFSHIKCGACGNYFTMPTTVKRMIDATKSDNRISLCPSCSSSVLFDKEIKEN